jgi:hypothetical protein
MVSNIAFVYRKCHFTYRPSGLADHKKCFKLIVYYARYYLIGCYLLKGAISAPPSHHSTATRMVLNAWFNASFAQILSSDKVTL